MQSGIHDMKIIPNYFIGLLPNGIPVYCNVEETIQKGFLVPLYTSKRRVKNHDDIVRNPNQYFNLLGLGNYIREQCKIPDSILVGFCNSRLSLLENGRYPTSRPFITTPCISINCQKPVVVLDDGVQTCPYCNRSFIME
jgi:hypothetical protein